MNQFVLSWLPLKGTMKTLLFTALLSLSVIGFSNCNESANANTQKSSSTDNTTSTADTMKTSFYDLSILALNGKDTIKMSDFKGKMVLCVNVASECGYTPQYEGLEALHKKYQDKLVIIGFPCNQFGGQEPGSPDEIQSFCKKNYGVTFQLTEKIDVKGDKQHPIYTWLTSKSSNGIDDYKVKWNFNKFLIGADGHLVKYFPSGTKPLSEGLTSLIK